MVEKRIIRDGADSAGKIVVDLVVTLDELRKVQREVGKVNNKTQVLYLMKNRKMLLSRAESLKTEISKNIPDLDPLDIRFFQCFYRVLQFYGRGISESILWSFECETGHQPHNVVNYPETFFTCVEKMLGKSSSKKIQNDVLFEISNEFELQLSKKAKVSDAIKIARSGMRMVEVSGLPENRPVKGTR